MKKEYSIIDHMFKMGHTTTELLWEKHIESCLEEHYFMMNTKNWFTKKWWFITAVMLYQLTVIALFIRVIEYILY